MQQDLPLPVRKLEERMAALPAECDVMLLSELDGFLTGIMVCPELIAPGEWLPLVWGGGDPDVAGGCAFADASDFKAFCQLVIAHYNEIGQRLQSGDGGFGPVYDVDSRNDDVLWEIWLSGFTIAMAMRPESWMAIAQGGDEDAATALATLISLAGIETDDVGFTDDQVEAIMPMAPDLIPYCIEKLHAWRVGRDAKPRRTTAAVAKIGRDTLCPCESGRDYKICCGAN
jgi:uncharacterized protein